MLVSMCLLILMPCYFGSLIIARSDALTTCVYKSNWSNIGLKERKLIIILMERLKRTARVTVGHLFPMHLQTFTAVINQVEIVLLVCSRFLYFFMQIMNFAYRLLALVKNFE